MRPIPDPLAPKLCNNCLIREEKRNPPKKENMENIINIQIQCPINIHNEIEEYCINNGMTLTKYFLDLHSARKLNNQDQEQRSGKWEDSEEEEAPAPKKKQGKK